MSELRELAKAFGGDDVSWIHDGVTTEDGLVKRGDSYIQFLFSPFPDLKLETGFRALEIGSGLGYIMEAMERYARLQGLQAGRIIGLDIAAPMLEKAKARLSGRPFEFLQYDGVHIPLADGSLDFVYSIASLQHIPKPFVYNLFFEIKRLLSPTGFSLLHLIGFSHIPHALHPWADIVRDQVKEGQRSVGWIYFYSAEELRWVLGEGTGFEEVRVVEVGEALAVALSNVSSSPKPGLEQAAQNSAALTKLQDEHATLSVPFAKLKQEYEALSSEAAQHKHLAVALSEELRAIRTSRSWKITAPLRGIATVIRGL
jgi:2-polyprenyl-3-methyl-5-hydroxy-6-metoxy-1,4-benzoquinol methylase